MKNILLVCSAGMSTSMLVKKMQEAAEKKEIDVKIQAIAEAEAKNYIEEADMILLGPQVRFLLNKLKGLAGDTPVEVIDMAAYGTMNGEKVLNMALEKMGGNE